jgi:hypothetical protein
MMLMGLRSVPDEGRAHLRRARAAAGKGSLSSAAVSDNGALPGSFSPRNIRFVNQRKYFNKEELVVCTKKNEPVAGLVLFLN